MDIILGCLIVGLLSFIAIMQVLGKPIRIEINNHKTEKIDIPQAKEIPIDSEAANKDKQAESLDTLVKGINNIMTGGERDGN